MTVGAVALSALGMMLAACSGPAPAGTESPAGSQPPSASETPAPQEPQELTFWGWWDGDVADQIQKIIDGFNASHPGITVNYVTQSDMMNTFQAAAIAGDVPDIMLWDASEVRRYAALNQLHAIDGHLADNQVQTSEWNDESIRELTGQGGLYGLPINIDIWGLYANLDILKEVGIDKAPATWDEVEAAAVAAMKVDGVKVGLNMKMAPYLFNSFLVANAGQPLSDDSKTVNLDDRAKEVLNYFKELIDAGVYSTTYASAGGGDGFTTGEEAMTLWPTSMLRNYKAYAEDIDFTFMPIPAGRAAGAKAGGVQTSWSLVIPAGSKHAQAAEEFLLYVTHTPENSLAWAEIVGGFSALKAVQNDPQFANDPYLKNVLADLGNHKIRSDAPGFISLEGTVYGPEIEKMFEGTQTPEQTLEIMTTEGNKFLAQARGE